MEDNTLKRKRHDDKLDIPNKGRSPLQTIQVIQRNVTSPAFATSSSHVSLSKFSLLII